ncbi:MAG: hypothetical protein L0Z53_18185 [Acidobacteriales bacterium]|nr:hypothetical protein [Terriglobales bacterium]
MSEQKNIQPVLLKVTEGRVVLPMQGHKTVTVERGRFPVPMTPAKPTGQSPTQTPQAPVNKPKK